MTNSHNVRKSVARHAAVNLNQSVNQAPRPYIEFQDGLTMEKAATNMRDRLLIKLLLYTGIRISEALALTVDDINFNVCTITIRHLKASVRRSCPSCGVRLSKTAVFCPGCGKQVSEATASQREKRRLRTIPLDQGTIDLLKTYIERGGAVEKDGKKFIFNINRHRAWQVVKSCAERAGLSPIFNPRTGKVHHISPHCDSNAAGTPWTPEYQYHDGLPQSRR